VEKNIMIEQNKPKSPSFGMKWAEKLGEELGKLVVIWLMWLAMGAVIAAMIWGGVRVLSLQKFWSSWWIGGRCRSWWSRYTIVAL
jgi:hypothetical protein